jgi:spore coat polysaccharide biosynthesis protein SpsF (cytidylyltransferase family)
MVKRVRKRVAIAIQARLASTRFPEKSVKPISETGMSSVTSLIQNCRICADHVGVKRDPNTDVSVDVWVLVPENELEFWSEFLAHKHVRVHGGSPTNVLSRYTDLMQYRYDYIMRLTADCPNVPNLAMNKAIWTAIYHDLDYCSNVWEDYRTCPDGHDIEVMSFKAMAWLSENSDLDKYKEHVTLALREMLPKTLQKGCLVTKEDLSHIKLCIDTEDEYKQACERFGSAYKKRKGAIDKGLYVYEY